MKEVVYTVGILGQLFWNTTPSFGTPPHRGFWDNFLEHHPNFWNTTPSRILGQLFGAPPQLLEHHPIEPRGFWDNLLKHHPITTPSMQQREHQPARVGVLVQPLEHHPTEPQGPDRESGTLTGGADQPLGRRKK